MPDLFEKHLTTDVLIIGAGGTGLRAAIEAKKKGAEVLVVSKGKFPSGCNTALAGGVMLAPFNKEDNTEKYTADTMRSGNHMNYPHLVRRLVEDAANRAQDLKAYGTEHHTEGKNFKVRVSNDCSVPRALPAGRPYSGDWFKGLVNETNRLEIPVLDRIMVVDLLKDQKAVTGAVGIDYGSESILIISSKSLILATGGGGNLYAFSTNEPSITGDGYALAYKAGARLSHMEFVQMRQCIIYPDAMKGVLPPFDGFTAMGGRFFNGLHQRYMKLYHPERLERVTRAEMARCAQLEIMAGRQSAHGGIYGDLSDVSDDQLKRVEKFMNACQAAELDPSWQPYEWSPASHHFMGGVVIDDQCKTGVSGLYAAGEVAAGVHGANRMGGNALTETQVFGAIAGKSAADSAGSPESRQKRSLNEEAIKTRIRKIMNRESGSDHLAVRSDVVETMSKYVGVIRNQEGLQRAISFIETIKETKADQLFMAGERSMAMLTKLLETENLLMLGELTARAALLRTESRGAHQREDFPGIDKGWDKHIVFQLENNMPAVKTIDAGFDD